MLSVEASTTDRNPRAALAVHRIIVKIGYLVITLPQTEDHWTPVSCLIEKGTGITDGGIGLEQNVVPGTTLGIDAQGLKEVSSATV
jgi:hypothetical protein